MSIKGNVKARLLAMILALALVTAMACPALAETFSAIVTAGAMTVYKDAKLGTAVTTLSEGEIVRVEAYSGRAARISWAGGKGYAAVSDMKSVDSVAAKAVVTEAASVYESASETARAAAVPEGTHVYVLSYSGDWARVEKDGSLALRFFDPTETAPWATCC